MEHLKHHLKHMAIAGGAILLVLVIAVEPRNSMNRRIFSGNVMKDIFRQLNF